MIQCEHCQLENAEGALYCARCHGALPRPLAPGECPCCGFLPEVAGEKPDICPSCGNDPERGKEVRARRVAVLQSQADTEMQQLTPRTQKVGCLPLLIAAGIMILMTGAMWR